MTSALLAIDQGTSHTKAILVDRSGEIVARASKPVGSVYPRPGWVEQDAEEIWRSVCEAVEGCLARAPGVAPLAVAVTNQRESAVAWQRSDGRAAGPVIGWQDSRTADVCERLRAERLEPLVRTRTGLALDPMFSATKLRWLLERAPGGVAAAERGELCAGTIDAWIVWRLTRGEVFACEAGNAARTQLLDLRSAAWDAELCELFGVPLAALPEVRRSDGNFGNARGAGSLLGGAPPISAVMADSHAALYGHGCFAPGAGKATFGTGSSVMTPVRAPVAAAAEHGVAETLAWRTGEITYALEGNVIATGAALDWMAALLGAGSGAGLEALATQEPATGGVHFVPAFAGLGAPYWDRSASGVIDGLTRGTTRPHLARAALEAVAFQVADVVAAIDAASGKRLQVLFADGGVTDSELAMQLQSDLSGRPVLASVMPEMSALGVAHMAGVKHDVWPDETALSALPHPSREYRPRLSESERGARMAGWHAAVARSRARGPVVSSAQATVAV